MEDILLDKNTLSTPLKDEEWITKIIDDNFLSIS